MDSNTKNIAQPKFNILRFFLVSALLCAVMAASLSFYSDDFAAVIKKLDNSSNDMDNMIWVVKHIGNLLPAIAIFSIQGIVYSFAKSKLVASRERKWQALILIIFVYAVLLPYTVNGRGLASIESSSLWFATQIIPLIILMMYNSQRQSVLASGEDTEADEAADAKKTEEAKETKNVEKTEG